MKINNRLFWLYNDIEDYHMMSKKNTYSFLCKRIEITMCEMCKCYYDEYVSSLCVAWLFKRFVMYCRREKRMSLCYYFLSIIPPYRTRFRKIIETTLKREEIECRLEK